MPVEEHTLTLDGSPVFYRGAPGHPVTPVYLHTAPTSSDDWTSLLESTGGIAPDLIGFGRSGKGGHLDYTPEGIASFVALLLDELEIERISLAGHGWGAAVAVALAARRPDPVTRLALINPAPAEQWHRLARLWRTPVIGELAMGSINRLLLARILRGASASPEAWPDDRVRAVWGQFDQGTQRATLRLHRWATPTRTEELVGARPAIPTLSMWGAADPWFPPNRSWPASDPELFQAAGHWPWLDQPQAADRIADFMAAS